MAPAAQRSTAADTLDRYRAKRDFSKTPEPAPQPLEAAGQQLRFAVQRHDARRLHFDLRLELGGVLKSWAVTKGPSMKAGVRRLAVETEDHPAEYLEWEGVIPKGQYGAGTMIVWDQGHWLPEGDPVKALKAGKLRFALLGERLKGAWSLVRMTQKPGEKQPQWLLIKARDGYALGADEEEPVERFKTSVTSGAGNDSLAARGAIRPDHKARQAVPSKAGLSTSALARIAGAKKGILPPFAEPSLAVSVDRPPEGPGWIHEAKHDGYRMQARVDGGTVKLLTRNGLDWTARFPPVAAALKALAAGSALIDGEITVLDDSGRSSFSGLQRDLKAKRYGQLVYYVFDLLYCNGVDLRGAALRDRKRCLSDLIAATPAAFALRYNDHIDQGGQPVLAEACRLGLEGIVSKRLEARYVPGRGEHWQKSKCALRQEFVVVGYVPSSAAAKGVGSLVLGYHAEGKLFHAGRAGTGIGDDTSRSLGRRLDALQAARPAFANAVTQASSRGVRWAKPELVAEIEYRGWSSDHLLRQAAFKGLREDKPADEVVLEQSEKPRKQTAKAEKVTVTLTHPERVLWTDPTVTKRDLADFYTAIAGRILPEISGRVLSLRRCPDGAEGECFFAKHAWMGMSDAVRLVDVGSEKPMLAVDDLAGLLELVQMNVLEIHCWGSRVSALERPDRMTFDLDPGDGVSQAQLAAAAFEVKERLVHLKLESFAKATGGKGVHVVVPLEPRAEWDEVKAFSKAFADLMAQDNPGAYISKMTKSRRAGKVFVDYLRNGRGATAIAAYSTRSRPHAPVAMPISWEELRQGKTFFDIAAARQRLARPGNDPWSGMARLSQRLPVLK